MIAGSSAGPEVSVVIPTYRRRASVERALKGLCLQTFPSERFETVVSIDGSEDGTRESVAALRAPFSLRSLWQPNGGRAAACNAGIRAARGDLVILLDDDMEPAPHFVAGHVEAHFPDRAPAGLRGVIGAVPVVVTPDSSPVVRYIAEGFAKHLEKLAQPGREIGIRDFYSGNFSIAREALLRVGLFDESFREYGNEDGELAIRLRAAGVALTYSSEALAWQHYQKDFPGLARDKMASGRTSVVSALRHPESVPAMRIGTYRRGQPRWRLLRSLLISASRPLPFLPAWVLAWIRRGERRGSPRLKDFYFLALDYFYWLGVRSALREHPEARGRLLH